MIWFWCFSFSVFFFSISIIFAIVRAKTKYKRGRILDSTKVLFIGVIVASIVLFIPLYKGAFHKYNCGIFETVLISIHNMIRIFIVDGEFEFVTKNLKGLSSELFRCYTVLFSILFVTAPILTFRFAMSFFKNISAYKQFVMHYWYNVFVFSELNEKSLALATSLSKKPKKRLIVFTGVFDGEKEQDYGLVEKAKELGAICFKKDISSIDFSFHSNNASLSFFAFCDDELKNVNYALSVIEKYKNRKNTNLYISSSKPETEMILTGAINKIDDELRIKVRRINEVQSLIFQNLYKNGYEKIFDSASVDKSGIKKINAIVLGIGQYGTEMIKALSWFCQMDGYLLEINAFDIDYNAEQKFTSSCPELMKFSGVIDVEGENKYTINIHSNIDVDLSSFDDLILSLPRTTYAFVALGDDEKNISVSIKLRSLFERLEYNTQIQSIVHSSEKKEALVGTTNFKGQKYNIDFIGDVNFVYSEEVVLNSSVEAQALKRHIKWGNESDFWKYNYNYKSSMASAIHHEMKVLCGIPGIEKKPEDRSHNELWGIRILEHCRWNAYMRSEGYVYGGTLEKSGRNDLAKTHNCLVPFSELPLNEQEKDDN